jgi:integrase
MANIEKRTGKNGDVSYRVKVRIKGAKPETATFKRLTDAKRWETNTESAIREGRHFKSSAAKRHTLGEMIDKYIKDVLPEKPKSAPTQKSQLLWWKEQVGHLSLANVTAEVIAEQRDKLARTPVVFTRMEKYKNGMQEVKTERARGNATVNRYLAALSHAFSLASTEWKWLSREQNPMPDVTARKEPRGRVRFLSDDERSRLLTACKESGNPLLYPAVVLALSTGMRAGETMRLTWDDVDFQRRMITLHETKNTERRAAPLVGLAYDELKALSKVRRLDTNLIFASKQVRGKHIDLRSAWETAIKKAGIEDFRWHDLRHSAASYLAMNGATLAEIAEVLGHKTLQMVKRYAHLTETHVSGVVERMNQKIFGG